MGQKQEYYGSYPGFKSTYMWTYQDVSRSWEFLAKYPPAGQGQLGQLHVCQRQSKQDLPSLQHLSFIISILQRYRHMKTGLSIAMLHHGSMDSKEKQIPHGPKLWHDIVTLRMAHVLLQHPSHQSLRFKAIRVGSLCHQVTTDSCCTWRTWCNRRSSDVLTQGRCPEKIVH